MLSTGCSPTYGAARQRGAMPKPPKDWLNRFATRTCSPRFSNAILPSRATTEATKLKTYQTSLGFYDLVVAAPSIKAARRDDVQAVGAQAPGGIDERFAEHSDLPSDLGSG
jgi:hypothetical protein